MPVLDTAPLPLTGTADPGFLRRLAAGDDATWRQVVRQYEGLLRGSARGVLRNDADVDEAVQRTWILLLSHADRINDADRLSGWLATTVRREALAIVRGQQRSIPSEDVGDRAGIEDPDLAAELMRAELEEALHSAVNACRSPSDCWCARCCGSPPPTTSSAANWGSRGAASGRCGGALSAPSGAGSSPVSPDGRPGPASSVLVAGVTVLIHHVLDALPDRVAHRELGMGVDGPPQPAGQVVVQFDVLLEPVLGAVERQLHRHVSSSRARRCSITGRPAPLVPRPAHGW